MKHPALVLVTLCAFLPGCVAPAKESPPGAPDIPVAAPAPRPAPSGAAFAESFEQRHRARALGYARDGNLADALVQWELLALIRPQSQEYRNAIVEIRGRIATQTANHLQSAEQAKKQGNLDQAELWYLRVLNLDRDNTTAAGALREIDAERTRRVYGNRPPRVRMQ